MQSIHIDIVKIKISTQGKISSHHFRAFMLKRFPESNLAQLSAGLADRVKHLPLIQYKIIKDSPFIYAMEKGVEAVKEVLPDLTELYLGHKNYPIEGINEEESDVELGMIPKRRKYLFETPWLALGELDYGKFKYLYQDERSAALSKMLIRNILGIARAFECKIDSRIKVKHNLSEIPSFKLGTSLPGFVGEFETNFQIPVHMGLGNMSDRGFGSVILK